LNKQKEKERIELAASKCGVFVHGLSADWWMTKAKKVVEKR